MYYFYYRRLRAKRAIFSGKGRSLSLASFSFPAKKVANFRKFVAKSQSSSNNSPHQPIPVQRTQSKQQREDEKYLQDNKPQGELEILGLESLIEVNDVVKRSQH
jgi:hypothetical protein